MVESVLPGAQGGDVQIAARVVEGEIAAVIFLSDSLTSDVYGTSVSLLLRVCQLHDVPIATNLATAKAVVMSLG